MTRGDELNKILDMKMGVDQAETHFNAINMKLENMQIIFNKVKMEVEGNFILTQQTVAFWNIYRNK